MDVDTNFTYKIECHNYKIKNKRFKIYAIPIIFLVIRFILSFFKYISINVSLNHLSMAILIISERLDRYPIFLSLFNSSNCHSVRAIVITFIVSPNNHHMPK